MKATVLPLFLCFLCIPLFLKANWIVESDVLDNSVDAGLYNSIALDPDGLPHIAYLDADNSDLRHVEPDGADAWTITTPDSSGDSGAHCSIAVDSSGTPHISYQYSYNQAIPYPPYSLTLRKLMYVSDTMWTP